MTLTGLCLGIIILILTLIMKGVNTMGETPRILQTSAGHTIEVIGGHLISNKFFNLVAMLLTSDKYFGEYQINSITFSEDKPEGKFGAFIHINDEGEKMILINLQLHFDNICENVQKEKDINAKYLSFRASLWYGVLTTVLHECFHAVTWATAPDSCIKAITNEVEKKAIEDDCNSAAFDTTFELFRDIDCEPAAIAEEPFFSMRFMKFFIDNIKDGSTDWAIRQGLMIENNWTYFDEEDKDGLPTMREWLRICAAGDPELKDKRWDTDAKVLPNAAINPAVMVAGAAEVKEMQVAEVPMTVPKQSAEAEKAIFNTPVTATGDFTQVADNVAMVEAMDTALDNAQTIDIEDDGSPFHDDIDGYDVQAELKAAKDTVEIPTTTQKTCVCGVVTHAEAKFCSNCGKALGEKTECAFGENLNLGPFGQQQTTQSQSQPVPQSEFITPNTVQPATIAPQRYTQSLRNNLPNINMDVANMKRILEIVYYRMHEHCFTKCGFQICGGTTGNAVGWNPAFAGNILETINITDIPGATELIIAIDKYNSQTGKVMMKTPITDGTISGKITKDSQLPSYAIYINNNGIECKRIFMVQNPFKATTAGYSPGALKAQIGNQISWVWDGADKLTTGGRRWIYKIENGIAEWL